MPTYRTGAATYVIQQIGLGSSGAAADVADFIDGSFVGLAPVVSFVPPRLKPVLSFRFVMDMSGYSAGEGFGEATMKRYIEQSGRSAGRGGYRPRLMPAARLTVAPAPTIFGGFEP